MVRATELSTALERVRQRLPDVVVVRTELPDGRGVDLCRIVRDDDRGGASVPIIVTSTGHTVRAERIAALEAGAWHFVTYPLDTQEFVLRVNAFLGPKRILEQARAEGLVDEPTELYSKRGLERRARELQALAFRYEQPLACVMLAPTQERGAGRAQSGGRGATLELAALQLANTLKAARRTSDVVGRLGKTVFAILAPNTDADGAQRLAERLAGENLPAGPAEQHFPLRAGFEAVSNLHETPMDSQQILEHAAVALKQAIAGEGRDWVLGYEQPER
jgi:PleD family two-component response regulator